jgi:hypothetical protein
MTLLALAGLAASLGWKPFEHRQPQGPIAVIERPPRRDISTPPLSDGLLALLTRPGAKVQANAIVEPEAIQFKYDVQRDRGPERLRKRRRLRDRSWDG